MKTALILSMKNIRYCSDELAGSVNHRVSKQASYKTRNGIVVSTFRKIMLRSTPVCTMYLARVGRKKWHGADYLRSTANKNVLAIPNTLICTVAIYFPIWWATCQNWVLLLAEYCWDEMPQPKSKKEDCHPDSSYSMAHANVEMVPSNYPGRLLSRNLAWSTSTFLTYFQWYKYDTGSEISRKTSAEGTIYTIS